MQVLDDGCICTGCKYSDYKECEVFRVVTAMQHVFELLKPVGEYTFRNISVRLEVGKCSRRKPG